jgi:prophage antirepressor-like protein
VIRDTGFNYKTQTVIINESGLYALILSSKLAFPLLRVYYM